MPRHALCTAPAAVALSALSALCALFALAAPASAQTQKMRPGLWEHSVTMKSQSGEMEAAMAQMQKSLASLPPAQRKEMEKMLAQQGVGMGAGGTTVKVCVTPEEANLDRIPAQEGCTQKVQRTGPNALAMSFSCKGEDGSPPTSGEGTVTFASPTAYTGQFKIKTQSQGKPEQIDMAQTGRWISADCGAIKPPPSSVPQR